MVMVPGRRGSPPSQLAMSALQHQAGDCFAKQVPVPIACVARRPSVELQLPHHELGTEFGRSVARHRYVGRSLSRPAIRHWNDESRYLVLMGASKRGGSPGFNRASEEREASYSFHAP